ncbi:hypothetical protein [Motilimonas pumila]|uniref:Uncharacterized protein n=1 Tax=Motilimonas pumila TaxID=2303987 RepID=A0A418YBE0_9GAMM|nr:hypothetical protein [Motilimonas pumila]RJG40283.1 hypothetical protein D1Z90_16120 [Motilimonas pumila]
MVLPDDKKLIVICRVEPGCLGPQGVDYIEDFCLYAEQSLLSVDSAYIRWRIIPRYDKSLPETQYMVADRKLSPEQGHKYMSMFDKNLEDFEEHLHEKLSELIDQHLGR